MKSLYPVFFSLFILASAIGKAQTTFLGTAEVNQSITEFQLVEDLGDQGLLIHSGTALYHVNSASGEVDRYEGLQYFSMFDLPSGPVYYMRSDANGWGLFKRDGTQFTIFKWLYEGAWNMADRHLIHEGRAYFTHGKNLVWVTDGTANGSYLLDSGGDILRTMTVIEDTLHYITGGVNNVHIAVHRFNQGRVFHHLDFFPGQQTNVLQGGYIVARSIGQADGPELLRFYDIANRELVEIENPAECDISSWKVKHEDGFIYGTGWKHAQGFYQGQRSCLVRVHIELGLSELINYTDEALLSKGMIAAVPLNDGVLVFGALDSLGHEVYWIAQDMELELVKDIYTGSADALQKPSAHQIAWTDMPHTIHGGFVYFLAKSPQHGAELWRSNGTPEGTRRMTDFAPRAGGVMTCSTFATGKKLFAAVKTSRTTLEVYEIDAGFGGFADETGESQDGWDRYFIREGSSNESYMSPWKEPRLYTTPEGSVGMLTNMRLSPPHLEMWRELAGSQSTQIDYTEWGSGLNIIYGLDSAGMVQHLVKVIGQWDGVDMVADHESGLMYLTVKHKDWSMIGLDTLAENGDWQRLVCIDSYGRILWQQNYNLNRDNLFVQSIRLSDRHILLSGYYADGYFDAGNGITLQSPYNRQYLIAAFDRENGQAMWASNTPMDGLQRYGHLGQMRVDEESGRVIVSHSDHGLTTWNSCLFGDWRTRFHAVDLESGSHVWTTDLSGDDMIRVRDIAVDAQQNVWAIGNFRGTASIGGFQMSASGESNCPQNPFVLKLTGSTGAPMMLTAEGNARHKRSRNLLRKGNFMEAIYLNATYDLDEVLPPYAGTRIALIQKDTYSITGIPLGSQRFATGRPINFGGISGDEDASFKTAFAFVDEDHFLLKLTYYDSGSLGLDTLNSAPFFFGKSPTTIIKRADAQFQLPEQLVPEPFGEAGFVLYPNPTTNGEFTMRMNPSAVGLYRYLVVHDATGRLLFETRISSEFYSSTFALPGSTPSGIYVVSLVGDGNYASQKLIVY